MKRSLQRSGLIASWVPSAFFVTGSSASAAAACRAPCCAMASVACTTPSRPPRWRGLCLLLGRAGAAPPSPRRRRSLFQNALAVGGVALGEHVDRVPAHVLEPLLPERGGDVVFGREVARRIDDHHRDELLQLLLGEAGRDRDPPKAGGEEVVRHDIERRARLPDDRPAVGEGVRSQFDVKRIRSARRASMQPWNAPRSF